MRYWKYTVALLLALPGFGQTWQECRKDDYYGRQKEAAQCYTRLTQSPRPADRAEGLWGLRNYVEANKQFQAAVKQNPKSTEIRVRWGRLFEERWNRAEAEQLFNEVLQDDPKNSQAMLGLALVASDGYEKKAVDMAHKALEQDPKLLEAQELLSFLALEDNNEPKAIEEANKALQMSPDALKAMAILATIDWLNDKKETPWLQKALKVNPVYGDIHATAGHFFVLNRRYEEGIAHYRQALELDPMLSEARAELGVNLMRLGREKEAREQLERAYNDGFKSALTANSLTLMDSYKNFLTFKTDNTIIKLHKKEAELLRPYVESELKRAMATYEKKYNVKLNGPVQVEVYPDHEDFAVRTMGMPGLGALGVTFGTVVAMDSPSGRPPGQFHWASTLWHELSHVYVLTATKHRVPRWFTEGLAVYEETATEPDWGDRLDPEAINAIKTKKLLPIAELDRGFIRPSYPSQVVVSYFQAGQICEYIAGKWGYSKLLDMMHAFAAVKPTAEVVQEQLGMKPEEFDKQFLAWLEAKDKKTLDGFDEWRKMVKQVAADAKAGKHDEVIAQGLKIRDLYPDYVEAGSVYEFLADAYEAKGDKANAMKQLEAYSKVGGRAPSTLMKLADLQAAAGKKKEAAATLERLNYIYPMDEAMHRKLGDLWMDTGNAKGAIMEYQAVLAAKPLDQAASRFNLARALRSVNRTDDAREQLLLALESAPGYKPAQRMLLEISK